jgi:hypothetical protein
VCDNTSVKGHTRSATNVWRRCLEVMMQMSFCILTVVLNELISRAPFCRLHMLRFMNSCIGEVDGIRRMLFEYVDAMYSLRVTFDAVCQANVRYRSYLCAAIAEEIGRGNSVGCVCDVVITTCDLMGQLI